MEFNDTPAWLEDGTLTPGGALFNGGFGLRVVSAVAREREKELAGIEGQGRRESRKQGLAILALLEE